jgi:hypothetical protein
LQKGPFKPVPYWPHRSPRSPPRSSTCVGPSWSSRSACARHVDPTDLTLYATATSRCGTIMAPSPVVCITTAYDKLIDVYTNAEARLCEQVDPRTRTCMTPHGTELTKKICFRHHTTKQGVDRRQPTWLSQGELRENKWVACISSLGGINQEQQGKTMPRCPHL